MILSNNTILITGGSSGLGLQMAKDFLQKNNRVLICGRSIKKLEEAKKQLPNIEIFQCDISKKEECEKLANWVAKNHPNCNVLINNAAIVHNTSFVEDEKMVEKAIAEINTNLTAPIILTKLFIPILQQNKNPQLINVTSGLAYIPRVIYPIYNATKAGLHSFTQMLRKQLEGSDVCVTEVFFPVVDTPFHKGNAPKIAITAQEAVKELYAGLEKDKPEIRIGKVKILYKLSRFFPSFAFKAINQL